MDASDVNSDSHCHVSCWGAVTFLTVQRSLTIIFELSFQIQVWKSNSCGDCRVCKCAVQIYVHIMFFHAVCMIRCRALTTEEICSVPRNANVSNTGGQNDIMLVLDGRQCHKMYCVSVWWFGISCPIIFGILLVYKLYIWYWILMSEHSQSSVHTPYCVY